MNNYSILDSQWSFVFYNKDEHGVGNHCQEETIMKIYQFLERKNTRKSPLQRVWDLVAL